MANNVINFPVPPLSGSNATDGGAECSMSQAIHYGAFVEDALDLDEVKLSLDIEKRREIVEQVDAIHRLEGFSPEEAPDWFKDLTKDYILGNLTAEAVTQRTLDFIKNRQI